MLIFIKNKVINTDKIIAAEYANYEVIVYLEAPDSVSQMHIPVENEVEAKKILIRLASEKIA